MSARRGGRLLALDLPPGEEFLAALDAAWDTGDAVLPLDPKAPGPARRRVLATMRPHAVIDATGITAYDDPAPLERGDIAVVITTSGSTGEAKGAQLTRAALDASAAATAQRIDEAPGDHWLSCLPWQHIGGLQVPLRARRAGLPLTVLPDFEVGAVSAAIAAGASLTSLVPTQLGRLLGAAVDLAPLKAILLGGAAAPADLLAAARKSGAPVTTTYGMSETCGGCVYDGSPLPGVQIRVAAQDQRIEIGGPTLMAGYRLRPDLDAEVFTADGWLRTGDLGRVDPDGRLQVLGRADDVIVTGGEKVVAGMLAAEVASHPGVIDAVVVGLPDQEWGERVVAVVQPVPGAAPTVEELRGFLADELPGWSLPRALVTVAELPRLPSGKPDRLAARRVAERALGDHGR